MKLHSEEIRYFFQEYGKVTLLSVGMCLYLCVSFVAVNLTSQKKMYVSFLDVGQGDAILIQTPSGHDVLIDGGPDGKVLERLSEELSYFDREIELMIATHGDADHITGLISTLDMFKVKKVVMSSVEAKTSLFETLESKILSEGGDVYIAKKTDVIDFEDGVMMYMLYPSLPVPSTVDTNDASVSVVLIYGQHSFLLTGDLSSKYESKLLGSSLPKNITVYKAGHHGSDTSSGEQLLTYIKPEYVVISAGKDNRYGHPHPKAVERLKKYSKEVLSTIDQGTITFISDGKLLEVRAYK